MRDSPVDGVPRRAGPGESISTIPYPSSTRRADFTSASAPSFSTSACVGT